MTGDYIAACSVIGLRRPHWYRRPGWPGSGHRGIAAFSAPSDHIISRPLAKAGLTAVLLNESTRIAGMNYDPG
eukprot:343095-Hanusia_phi.AAC.1